MTVFRISPPNRLDYPNNWHLSQSISLMLQGAGSARSSRAAFCIYARHWLFMVISATWNGPLT